MASKKEDDAGYDAEIEQLRRKVDELKVKVESSKKELISQNNNNNSDEAKAKHAALEAELHHQIAKLNSMDCSIWQNSLPPELMEQIFSFLDSFTRLSILPLVCQWWRANALRYPVVDLATISKQFVKKEFQEKLLKIIVMRGHHHQQQHTNNSNMDNIQLPHVITLKLKLCNTEKDTKIVTICFPNLTKLEIHRESRIEAFETIVTNLPHIQYLDLGYNSVLTDNSVEEIAAGLKELKVFKLWDNKNVTNRSLVALLKGCPLLTELSFWYCRQVTGETNNNNNNNKNKRVYPKLRKFKSDCITDGGLLFLAEVCPNVTQLDLYNNENITDTGLATIGNAWGHCLLKLNLTGCIKISDDGLEALAAAIKNKCINNNNSSNNNNNNKNNNINNSPLRVLNINGCIRISRGLEAIAAVCPNLVFVDITYCKQVSPAQMAAVATHCPLLEKLIVGDNESIGNQCIIDHVSRLHKLKKLHLSGKPTLSPEAAQALVRGCPLLSEIRMHSRMNDDAMVIVAAGLPNLQKVDIYGSNISDASLHSLAAHCPFLTYINLNSNNNITDEGMEALAAVCPRLRVVDIRCCDKLTVRSLTALASHDCRYSLEIIFTRIDLAKQIKSQLPRLLLTTSILNL